MKLLLLLMSTTLIMSAPHKADAFCKPGRAGCDDGPPSRERDNGNGNDDRERERQRENEREQERQRENERSREQERERNREQERERQRENEREQERQRENERNREQERERNREQERERQRENEREQERERNREQERERNREQEHERQRENEREQERERNREQERERNREQERERERERERQRPNPNPGRPEQPRPNPNPGRPEQPRPNPGTPRPPDLRDRREGRGNTDDAVRRRREIEQRRDIERRERERQMDNIRRRNAEIEHRRHWWRDNCHDDYRRESHWNSRDYWRGRWDQWWIDTMRPSPYYPRYPIIWPEPMPDYNTIWNYRDVQIVARNIENLTEDIYFEMLPVVRNNPNQEYARRLPRVLAELADAAQAYTDAVNAGYDTTDSLNELFYLESKVLLAERTLSGYSQAYRVDNEMETVRYYVRELLWFYRQTY